LVKRSINQNSIYHEFVAQLHKRTRLLIYNGEFELLGYDNPLVIKCRAFSLLDFRNLLKQVDLFYPKDENGVALSSTKLDIEKMNGHINWLEVLISEGIDG